MSDQPSTPVNDKNVRSIQHSRQSQGQVNPALLSTTRMSGQSCTPVSDKNVKSILHSCQLQGGQVNPALLSTETSGQSSTPVNKSVNSVVHSREREEHQVNPALLSTGRTSGQSCTPVIKKSPDAPPRTRTRDPSITSPGALTTDLSPLLYAFYTDVR